MILVLGFLYYSLQVVSFGANKIHGLIAAKEEKTSKTILVKKTEDPLPAFRHHTAYYSKISKSGQLKHITTRSLRTPENSLFPNYPLKPGSLKCLSKGTSEIIRRGPPFGQA